MMKNKHNLFLALFTFLIIFQTVFAQERYLNEVFDTIAVQTDITYADNITLMTMFDPNIGVPSSQPLKLDFYEPLNDNLETRPLVILMHSGNFLPIQLNGDVIGTRQDSTIVEIAHRLAKRGYAVAAMDYRLGWNPVSVSVDERASSLINAVYRGVQDVNTCVRFFRKDAAGDNIYRIDSERITFWGLEAGGYIATAAGAIDNYSDLLTPKFINTETNLPMVMETINGDPQGTIDADLNIPNHVGFSSEAQLIVNMGGAIVDTSLLTTNDPVYLNFHCPRDPFVPYMEEYLLIYLGGGALTMLVQGSYTIQEKVNSIGLNNVFSNYTFDAGITSNPSSQTIDATPFTQAANRLNDGFEGLFPLDRPCLPSIITGEGSFCEGSPWSWWNSEYWSTFPHPSCPEGLDLELCNYDVIARFNNNDSSPEKGNIYIDSIMGYFAPRACVALDLPCASFFLEAVNVEDVVDFELIIAPNPAKNHIEFSTDLETSIQAISIYMIDGQLLKKINNIQSNQYVLNRGDISTGMYVAKIQFEEGIIAKKIIFE